MDLIDVSEIKWDKIAGPVDEKRSRKNRMKFIIESGKIFNQLGSECFCPDCKADEKSEGKYCRKERGEGKEEEKFHHKKGEEIYREGTEEGDKEFCCREKDCQKLIISKRIGSASTAAEVVLITPQDAKNKEVGFVMKIMPIVLDKSLAENLNEIKIAKLASSASLAHLLTAEGGGHFPIVFDATTCTNTIFSPDSLLGAASQEYNGRQAIISLPLTNLMPPKLSKILSVRSKQLLSTEEFLQAASDLLMASVPEKLAKNYTVPELRRIYNNAPQPANLLFSERAWGDLKQLFDEQGKNLSPEMWVWIIKEIVEAIAELQNELGVVHRDLHLGNLLVAFDRGRFIVLIHDFGKSEIVEKWSNDDRKRDLELAISEISKRPELSAFPQVFEPTALLMETIEGYQGTDNLAEKLLEDLQNLLF